MILYSHPIYEKISPWLGLFECKRAYREQSKELVVKQNEVDVILFGMGRFGSGIAGELRQRGHRVLGVNFDPVLVQQLGDDGYLVRYGDAEDSEFLASLPLGTVRQAVSSVREMSVNLVLLQGLHQCNYKGKVVVTAHSRSNAEQLKQAGADRVLIPYADAAVEAVDTLFGR